MQKILPIIVCFFFLVISACTSQTVKLTDQDSKAILSQSNQSKNTPEQLITQYESKLAVLGEELSFYGPIHYQLASEKYLFAQTLIKQNKASEQAKLEISAALHLLDMASQNKSAVKLHLKKVDMQYLELKKLQSPTLLPDKFNTLNEEYKTLINMIEKGMVQDAIKEENNLIEKMIRLEIDSLVKHNLSESENLLFQAKQLNAEDYMPKDFKSLEASLLDIKTYIQKSYRNRQTIIIRSKALENNAKKLFYIAKEANHMRESNDTEIGRYAANSFEIIDKITNALSINKIEVTDYSIMLEKLLAQLKAYNEAIENKSAALASEQKESKIRTSVINKEESKPSLAQKNETTISPEINKAVLTELFEPTTNAQLEAEEESLEFDSIEIIK